ARGALRRHARRGVGHVARARAPPRRHRRARPRRDLQMKRRLRRLRLPRWARRPLIVVAAIGVLLVARVAIHPGPQPGPSQRVLATREGDIGKLTASRMRIRAESRFVALPHPHALGRMVEVRYRDRSIVVPVLDVGPWNIDDAYWENDDR